MFSVTPCFSTSFSKQCRHAHSFVLLSINSLAQISPFHVIANLEGSTVVNIRPCTVYFLAMYPICSIIDWVLIRTVRWPFVWLDEVNILLKKVDRISFCMAVYTMELHPAVKTSYDDHTLLE